MAAFVWPFFFGYTNETRRMYSPILRRIWEFTPFATRCSALEPLAFGSGAAHPRRRHGEISDISEFSTDRGDEGIQAPTVTEMTVLPSLDVESQAKEGPGGRSGRGWKRWFMAATGRS